MTTATNKAYTQQKAPTNDSKGLIAKLIEYEPATRQALVDNAVLTQLYDLEHSLDQTLGLDSKLLYLDSNISIGGEFIPTAGTIGLVLTDNQGRPASIASITPNSNNKPLITDTSQPCAFVIGDMAKNGQLWAVNSLDDGISLYHYLNVINGQPATILVNLISWSFESMIKHFAEVQPVYINITVDKKHTLDKLAGDNVKAVITTFDILLELEQGKPFDDIMAEATITDLQAEAWGNPEPLATDPSKPTPYPIDAWQGLLKSVVEKIAYYAQVPNAMAGQCVLGALAHIGQRFIDAPMGHKHMPASLYLVTEGESGSGKSVAMGLSHYEIKAYEREQYQIYLEQLNEWETEKEILQGKERKEYLANNPRPYNPITMFGDATIEPILDKFINGEMDNASWSTDEAGQFFNGHTMKGDTAGNALSALTTLYSDGAVNRLRSQKSQHANPRSQAYDVRMTLLLMGQRIVLEAALTDPMMNGQGFLARAMIACPDSLQGQRVWNDSKRRQQSPYDDTDLIAYWDKCRTLLDPAPLNNPSINSKGRIKVRWHDAQAEQAFYDGMQAIENRQAKGKVLEYLKAYASRMAENASRVASLMAFFEGRYTITTDDINRAFMLVEYSTSERLRYLDATPNREQNDSEKLSGWLVDKARGKNPSKLNYSYVYNGAPVPMRKNKALLLNELNLLESAGHIRQETEGKKQVIYINPKLYT